MDHNLNKELADLTSDITEGTIGLTRSFSFRSAHAIMLGLAGFNWPRPKIYYFLFIAFANYKTLIKYEVITIDSKIYYFNFNPVLITYYKIACWFDNCFLSALLAHM